MPFALGGSRTFTADFFVYGKREENGLYFLIFGKMRKLVLKYGEKPDEDDMDEADWFEYQAVKKYEDEVTGEMNRGKFLCQ